MTEAFFEPAMLVSPLVGLILALFLILRKSGDRETRMASGIASLGIILLSPVTYFLSVVVGGMFGGALAEGIALTLGLNNAFFPHLGVLIGMAVFAFAASAATGFLLASVLSKIIARVAR